jgi:hypothetical protein
MQLPISTLEAYAPSATMGATIMHATTRDTLASAIAAFEQSGGKVIQCPTGVHSPTYDAAFKRALDRAQYGCACGCKGDWTDHSMRLGESGL